MRERLLASRPCRGEEQRRQFAETIITDIVITDIVIAGMVITYMAPVY
jgi:hypothetical protein